MFCSLKAVRKPLLLFIAALALAFSQSARGDALQGQDVGSTNWSSVNLLGWVELDYIPFRLLFTSGPGTNTVTVTFPHLSGTIPGFEDLTGFTNYTTNVIIISPPTLSTPPSGTWSYTFTVALLDSNNAEVRFFARLAAGAHLNGGSSLKLDSTFGAVQIHKPGVGPGIPDLAITKTGPSNAPQGSIITYNLSYNNHGTTNGIGVQISDILPPNLNVITNTLPSNSHLVGNTLFFDLTNVNVGVTGQVSFQAQIGYSDPIGTYLTNFSQILSSQTDANMADNSSTWLTLETCGPPGLSSSLANIAACPGTSATFAPLFFGSQPLSYQWRKNTNNIAGATNATFTINSVAQSNVAFYDVIVTNPCGISTSSVASLVMFTNTGATPLTSVTSCRNFPVSFSTVASGTGPFTYQWTKAGTNIIGATNSTYSISSVSSNDAGNYCVVVSGFCTSVTNCATLTVSTNASTTPLISLVKCPGDTATFSTTPSGTGPFIIDWKKNGVVISGQTNTSLTISNVSFSDAATYCVEIAGTCNATNNCATLTVRTNLSATGPISQTQCPGNPVTFTVAASGTGPFAYQWYKDGGILTLQTNSSLLLAGISSADAGVYSVEVDGQCNSLTNFATLTVSTNTTADALISQTNCPGSSVSFSTTAHGTGPFTYQWYKDNSLLSAQTNSSITISNDSASDAGTYTIVVTGSCNSVTNSVTLFVNTPTTADPLTPQAGCPGATISFNTTGHGTGPFAFQWFKDGALLANQTNSSIVVSNIGSSDGGLYSIQVTGACNTLTNSAALTVYTPTSADAPVSLTNCPGTPATFSTIAHGTGPFSFQWTKGGLAIPGATNSSYSIAAVQAGDADTYCVQVSGLCNSVTNCATLTLLPGTTATALISLTNCPGAPASFSTTASGTGPFTYQWSLNGLPIPAATNNSYSIAAVQATDAGTYCVSVAGFCGSVTNCGSLAVLTNVSATSLNSLTNCPGSPAAFSTIASGTGPFTYQWSKDGSPIAGATNNSYSIAAAQYADAGNYCVIVTGFCSSVTNCASLTVLTNASATSLTSLTNCPATPASFGTTPSGTGPFSYQWKVNGANILSATNSTFSIPTVQATDAGTYCVIVTGACGSVTNCATLAVLTNTSATALTSLTNCPGTPAAFNTTTSGTGPFVYQWTLGGTNIPGGTNASFSIPAAQATDAGTYCVIVTGFCTSVTNCASLTVLASTSATALTSVTNCPGSPASFSTVPSGTGPFSYQWTLNGTNIFGATNSSYSIAAAQTSDAGTYCVSVTGVCNSVTNCATLTLLPTTSATSLASLTNCPGTPASFSTVASGTGPFIYQWTLNGTNIPSATNNSFSIPAVQATDAGTYCAIVTGFCTSVTNCATLTVLANTSATALTSLTNCPGSPASFSTTPSGTGPFTYQWTQSGTNIPGATNSSFSIPSVHATDAGTYCVVVAGTCNSVTNCATLTVLANTAASALTSLTNCPGTPATFSTAASGSGPFSYQWTINGTNILGATNNSYSIPAVQATDAGTYCVVVSGFCSSVTNCAMLTILANTAATPLTSLTNCPGTPAAFSTLASGTGPFTYQWTLNGSNVPGATNNSFSIPAVQATDAGSYCVMVTGFCTSVTNCATLTVLTNTAATALTSLTNCPGSAAAFSTIASGTGPFAYQWTLNGTNILNATNSSYSIPAVQATDVGSYCVIVAGFCTSVTNCATLTVLANASATALTSLTNCPGLTASFSTTASGTGPFSYQWTKNGTNILNATNNSFSIPAVQATDAGTYCVIVSGFCTSVTNCATLTVLANTTAAALTSLTNCPGSPASFSTTPSGTGPFTYQWTKNGTNILNATNSSFSMPAVQATDAGSYCVIVAGFCTSVTNCGTLTVLANTTAAALTSLTNCPGSPASFSTVPSGTGPFSYQWTKNGTNILNATNNSFSIPAVQATDAATYCVIVTGFCTSVTNCATLSVLANTSATDLTSLTNCPGTPASFSTVPSGTGPFTYQWTRGTNTLNATNSTFSIPSVQATDAGTYCVIVTGFCTSVTKCATLTVLANTTAAALTSLTNCPGSPASFSTTPSGTGPFAYQWSKNGTNILNATNSSFSIPAVQATDAGTYCVIVSGFCTSVTNCATLSVLANTSAAALTSLTNCMGTPAAFSTTPAGTGPFSYQWTKNGTNILNATNSAFSIPSVQAADAGTYCVIVTGFCTSATNCATLTALANTSTTSLTSLTNCPGTPAAFSTVPSGTGPFTYQWTKNGTNILNATNSAYSIPNVQAADAGSYCVIVTGFCTSATNCATLTVLANTSATALIALTNCPGSPASFSTAPSGTGPFNYQWTKNGTNILNATNSSFSIPAVQASDVGTYCVIVTGFCTSATNCATLTILANTSATAVTSLTNCPGTPAVFSTTPSGTGPFSYQWTRNGTNILNATNSSFSIPAVQATDAGTYCVIVTGFCTSATNCATLTVLASTSATALTSLTNCPGIPAVFSTTPSGTGPFSYQWTMNGTNILNATNSSYSIPAVQATDAGTYCVIVTGLCSSVTNCATLSVNSSVTADAVVSLTNCVGTQAAFATAAHGTGPVTYQWTKNGASIAAATNASYAIASVTLADTANYCVIVRAACGSVTNCASLIVVNPTVSVLLSCPGSPVAPGGSLGYSGVVSNSSIITLTNVTVVNSQPTNNTPLLGPVTLTPGQALPFSGAYFVAPDSCGPYVDTATAHGNALCTGAAVTASRTILCPGLSSPAVSISAQCPAQPTPVGQPIFISGFVTNSGNISLTNVLVVVNQPTNNSPVFGPIILAPGEFTFYSGSFSVPPDSCVTSVADIVSASGRNSCTGSNVTAAATNFCPVTTAPRLALVKNCPASPVPPGGLLNFSGTVSNAGDVTLTNIVVVNNQPANNTPVLGPISLAPGASTNFSGSYLTCSECCGPWVDTLTATANDRCTGQPISTQATASCSSTNTALLAVTKLCPAQPPTLGQPLVFSGSVSNSGNVSINQVALTDSQAGPIAQITALAPGQVYHYVASFTPTNCGSAISSTVTAWGLSACSGQAVTNSVTSGCQVACSVSLPVSLINPHISGGNLVFSFMTQTGHQYSIFFTPIIVPANWQLLSNIMGYGTNVTIQDPMTQTQRFYRVLTQ